eukprot:gnl/Spiro4/4063_TR2020_c0_g1_i1.p1 gnl/Spiro4/4063_TR2020_c0_g1~~gnl/Spiro4/4063_TR2020_c0_g1_i1.p1  ORF type:complete len:129 (+),score=25.64 gnl/Spiro4/4063_TR2020_c0_g1_i1:25-387(+)
MTQPSACHEFTLATGQRNTPEGLCSCGAARRWHEKQHTARDFVWQNSSELMLIGSGSLWYGVGAFMRWRHLHWPYTASQLTWREALFYLKPSEMKAGTIRSRFFAFATFAAWMNDKRKKS